MKFRKILAATFAILVVIMIVTACLLDDVISDSNIYLSKKSDTTYYESNDSLISIPGLDLPEPDTSEPATHCTPTTYQTPLFVELAPIHGHPLSGASSIWLVSGDLREDVRISGVQVQSGVEAFTKIITAYYGSVDSITFYGTVPIDTINLTFITNFTMFVHGVNRGMPLSIYAGSPTTGGTILEVVDNPYHIWLTDIIDIPLIFSTHLSVKTISVGNGTDSTDLGDGLQVLIDNCAKGTRIQYGPPIDPQQIVALEELGWFMQDLN